MNAPTPPLALVVGHARSGTTMLATMLNRHSQLCVAPETHFFSTLAGWPGGWAAIRTGWPQAAIDFLDHPAVADMVPVDAASIVNRFRQAPDNPAELFNALGNWHCRDSGKPHWLEKTPIHVRHIPLIRRLLPQTRFIHIIRDGRDVASSLEKKPWASDSWLGNLTQWKKSLDLFETAPPPASVCLNIRYEDILNNPQASLQSITTFLDIPFEDAMLAASDAAPASPNPDSPDAHRVRGPVAKNNQNKWQRERSGAEQRLADALCGDTLQRYSYPSERTSSAAPTLIAGNAIQRLEPALLRWADTAPSQADGLRLFTPQQAMPANTALLIITRATHNSGGVPASVFRWLHLKKQIKKARQTLWLYSEPADARLQRRLGRLFVKSIAKHVDGIIYDHTRYNSEQLIAQLGDDVPLIRLDDRDAIARLLKTD